MKFVFSESLKDAYEQNGSKGIAVLWGRTLIDLSKSLVNEHVQKEKGLPTMPSGKFISAKSAAIVGLILCLPAVVLYVLLMVNIDPSFGPLTRPMPDDGPDVFGSLMALCLLVFLPAIALVVNFGRIRQTMRAGGSIFTHPMSTALVIMSFIFIAALVGTILADQYPCWVGVPNCD